MSMQLDWNAPACMPKAVQAGRAFLERRQYQSDALPGGGTGVLGSGSRVVDVRGQLVCRNLRATGSRCWYGRENLASAPGLADIRYLLALDIDHLGSAYS